MGAANTDEAYAAIEKRLAPRLEAFVGTGHYAELTAILATAHATVAASPPGAGAHGTCGYNAASSALRHLRITPVTPSDSTLRRCHDDTYFALE
jgi:hypothetical protein